MKKFTRKDSIVYYGGLGSAVALAIFAMLYNNQIQAENSIYFPHPLSNDDLKKYTNNDPKAVVIFPILTYNAYKDGGFYDYYKGICKTCDTVSLRPFEINATYTTGLNSYEFLTQLHYPVITDVMVDQHPEILNDFDKIILLHNEYVTKKEFTAIAQHKNVIYLYPNALYTEVAVNYTNLTMKLVKGHGYDNTKNPPYPVKSGIAASNGFNYVTSSTHEYDMNCKNYAWESRPNGMEITCWPEFLIKSDRNVLQTIKDFPDKLPHLVTLTNTINMTSLPKCNQFGYCG